MNVEYGSVYALSIFMFLSKSLIFARQGMDVSVFVAAGHFAIEVYERIIDGTGAQ
ncbi:MAG: hypothetical protein JRE58_07110 [Deltaproteobacteria bacterium]|nr:hypothetical protein [Deltaproteobacteria bacterium]